MVVFVGRVVVAVVKDRQRNGCLAAVVLYTYVGDALLFLIADQVQVIAARLGLRPDRLIGAGAVDEVLPHADAARRVFVAEHIVADLALAVEHLRLHGPGHKQGGSGQHYGGGQPQAAVTRRQQLDGHNDRQAEQHCRQREETPRILEQPGQLARRAAQRGLHVIPGEDVQR